MKKTEFHQPTGEVIENISIDQMKKYVIDEFIEYWKQGSGDALIIEVCKVVTDSNKLNYSWSRVYLKESKQMSLI
ncbi:hypothetical protein [Listeria booriae]|uniref:Uncharacterized protein n=1 Tax=Listeria booriae TaxID=1552123 RepID=A0A7X0XUT1_9LIST|nr:hypothetical protein [Listeria booriae]MBC1780636.1 hypothetical protein [Listeria booriae]MBC1812908.1 hypothetical protein [Listeria booriae]